MMENNKMMRRIIILFMTFIVISCLGCGGDTPNNKTAQSPAPNNVTTNNKPADKPVAVNKTYFTASGGDSITLDMLKATLVQLDSMEKPASKRSVAKNNAIKSVVQYKIDTFEKPPRKYEIDSDVEVAYKSIYGALISDVKVMYYQNYDYKGHLLARVSCKLENVSDKPMTLFKANFYLFKEGFNSIKADTRNGGFYQNTIEEMDKNKYNIELMPGDFAFVVLTFKTSMTDKNVDGATIRYGGAQNVLFKIDGSMNAGGYDHSNDLKPSSEKKPSATATNAFRFFHDNITQRNFVASYSILSDSMKKYVGGYDNFVKGYETTISSKVIDAKETANGNVTKVEYILEAKDRSPSGTVVQRFKGTAVLVKNGAYWLIDEISAKKI